MNAFSFSPEKVRIEDYPHPVGSTVEGELFALYTVVDRGGYAFLACCPVHEAEGTASGWYPQAESGRLLTEQRVVAGGPNGGCSRG